MASTYPGAVDSLVRPDSTDPLSDGHAALHNATSDAVEAVQTELGVNPSGSEATVAARLTAAESATSAAQATATAAVPKATYDAHTVLAATTDNTPAAVTVAEQTIVGRKTGGNITALTAAETKTLLGLGTAAVVDVPPSGDATSGQVVKGSDSRLSDARTPTAHKTSHQSGGGDELTLAQAQITNLTTDLSAKAPLANPTFTGTPAAPTAAVDTNTTQIATTAFTVAQIADDAVLKTVADAAGDLVVGSAADTFGRLALGTDNHVLTVDTAGSGVAKVGWEDPTANPLTTAAMALKVNTATVGNLLTANQSSVETDTTGFVAFNNVASMSASTDAALYGSKSLAVTSTGSDDTKVQLSSGLYTYDVHATAGQTYTFSVYVKSAATPRSALAVIVWRDAGGSGISTTTGTTVTTTASGWTRVLVTGVAPAGTVHVQPVITIVSSVANEVHYFDGFGFWEGAGGQWALPGTPITDLGFYTDESVGRRLFQWDANNSRWQMTYGETGIRDVASSLETGEGYTTVTNLELRRIGNTVQLQAVTLARGSTGSGDKYCLTLPAGFWPDQTVYFRTGISDCFAYVLLGDGKVYIRTASTSDGFTLSWQTTTAWPTTLPGSAVGSIPA